MSEIEVTEYLYGECQVCGEVLMEAVADNRAAAQLALGMRAEAHAAKPHAATPDYAGARWLAQFLGEDIVDEIVGQG